MTKAAPSKIRRQNVARIRADVRANESRQSAVIVEQLRRAMVAKQASILWDHEFDLILRLKDGSDQKSSRGAPPVLNQLHRMMAAHALWLHAKREMPEKAEVAYRIVAGAWQVSIKAVEKAVGEHRVSAQDFVAAFAGDNHKAVALIFEQFAQAFRALATVYCALGMTPTKETN